MLLLLKWLSMQPQFISHKLYEEFLSEEIYSLGELTEQKGERNQKNSGRVCQFVAKLINVWYFSEFTSCLTHFFHLNHLVRVKPFSFLMSARETHYALMNQKSQQRF